MKVLSKISIGLVIAGCLSMSVYAEVVDRIVAIVNREVITFYQLQQAERQFSQEVDASDGTMKSRREMVLNTLIENELIRQEAEESGILVTDDELNAALSDIKQRNNMVSDEQLKEAVANEGKIWGEFLEEIREQIKMARLVNREVHSKVEISEDEVKTYYQSHTDAFKQAPSTVRVRHILLKVKEKADESEIQEVRAKAEELVQQLRAGADFADMAKQYSDHSSARSGGELGTFGKGELAAPFGIAFDMEVGEMSDPVQSPLGFHIINVQEKSSEEQVTYEKVTPEIRRKLFSEKSNEFYKQWIAELKEKAYVEIKE